MKAAYDSLGLQTYFTSGPTETRAWTIRKGMTAPQVLYCNIISSSSAKYIENVKIASAKLVIIMLLFFFVFCTGCWSDSL